MKILEIIRNFFNKKEKNFKIVLKLDKENILNAVTFKEVNDIDIIISSCWLINCALAAIEESYEKNSPRYNEMKYMYMKLLKQIREQITEEQYQQTYKHFRSLE